MFELTRIFSVILFNLNAFIRSIFFIRLSFVFWINKNEDNKIIECMNATLKSSQGLIFLTWKKVRDKRREENRFKETVLSPELKNDYLEIEVLMCLYLILRLPSMDIFCQYCMVLQCFFFAQYPMKKKIRRNRGIQWYAKPQFRLVFINRGSQTVYSVFINHQLPRHENTAILDAEKNRINGLTSAVVVHRCVVC